MSDTPEKKVKVDPASQHYRELVQAGLVHMSEAASEMNAFVAQRRRKVPEEYFVNILLPIIRAHVTGKSPELGLWLNVADGMHNRMDVVDNEGNVVCVVPPAFNNIPDRSTRPDPGSVTPTVAQLVQRQGDVIDNGDLRASMDIDQRIIDICTPRPEDSEKTENLVLLVRLYDRYSLPLEEILGPHADEFAELLRQNKVNEISKAGRNDDDSSEEPDLIY